MIKFLDFKRKYKRYSKEINSVVLAVFKRGWFIGGPERERFEQKFSAFCGAKYAISVNSGTDAIAIALKALKIVPGDEVITVSHTATPTVSAIRMVGATPVFVDVNDSMVMNPDLLKNKITKKTKAILPVHIYGYPADMKKIMKIAKDHNLFVVEDACQAHGARYGGRVVGSIGDIGCFSFYPTKNLGAFGDAGMMITNNKGIAERARMIRSYGEISRYESKIEGWNSRMDEIQAAVLSWGLEKLSSWNKRRTKIAGLYLKNLKNLPLILPAPSENNSERVWHLFVIRSDKRSELARFLSEHGIETAIHYPKPVFKQEAYKFLGYSDNDLPVTSRIYNEILSLPLYPELKDSEVLRICKAIKDFYHKT